MYNTSKYYSYIFYADRNVRPWMILGYTLTTFPKVTIYIYLCTTREEIRTLAQLQEKGPCISRKGTSQNFGGILQDYHDLVIQFFYSPRYIVL